MSPIFVQDLKTSTFSGTISVHTGIFLDGEFVEPIQKGTIDVITPTDGKVITAVGAATKEDIDRAVDAAEKAFKTVWGSKTPGSERGRLMHKLADLMEQHLDEIAAIEAINGGKRFMTGKMFDIPVAIQSLRYFAGWADKNQGNTIETDEAKFAYTINEPIGVCGCIVPWNFPLMIALSKLSPALATGNVVVLKPSEETPLSALKLAELVKGAGFPPGVINIVPGYGEVAGQAISEHPRIGMVSFTGSPVVGRKILEAASRTNMKRVALELGGKSPVLVFDDADLDQVIKWSAMNIFNHSGQMCIAGSRIYVQDAIYDRFVEALTRVAQSMQPGDLFDPDTNHSPMVSNKQLQRVLGYISAGKDAGAQVVTGGNRVGDEGFFIQPTIFTETSHDMRIVQEEIFGPVAVVSRFKDEDEAIKWANGTTYGLGANVFTTNIARATRMARALQSGGVWINMGSLPDVRVPFGGIKQSGQGREMGEAALAMYTNIKSVHVNIGVNI